MAKRSPPASTISAETMASVSGILMVKVVPAPATDFRSTVPPICSILLRTTSMPTPRPEMLVTSAAVEKPGEKDEIADLGVGLAGHLGFAGEPDLDGLGPDARDVEAAAVIGDLDDDVTALVAGA